MTDIIRDTGHYTGLQQALAHLNRAAQELEEWTANQLKSLKTSEVLRGYYEYSELHEQVDKTRKRVNAALEGISRNTIPGIFEDEGISTTTLKDIGRRFTVSTRMSCSMADPDAAKEWLRTNGHGALITETVNASTLAAFAKSQIVEQGKDLPPNLFKLSNMRYTSVTRAG